jgi:hypothetical protein
MMIFKGQELEHDLEFGQDLDGVVTLEIWYLKPGAVAPNFTKLSASRIGDTDVVRRVLTPTNLDTAGDWTANIYADYGGGKVIPGETVTFRVYEIGELR